MNAKPIDVLIRYPLTEEQIDQLGAISPRLRFSFFPDEKIQDVPVDVLENTEILLTGKTLPPAEKVPSLRWVQFTYAGIDFVRDHPLIKKENVIATTLSGAASPKVAEYAVMAMLALGHKLPSIIQYQEKKIWPSDRWDRFQPKELRGAVVGLLGYGSIAREIARLLKPFGATILATKNNLMNLEQTGYIPVGTGDRQGILYDRIYPPEAMHSMLRECDFVIVTLPLTDETRDVIGAQELAQMRPSAYLIALGRGGQVNEDALVAALRKKKIAGAILDVFQTEPLPQDSPLWEIPRLVITPHIAGDTSLYSELVFDLFKENLSRYLTGQKVLNVFEVQRGY